MQELIEAIKNWPVIVQGALGSAAFWLLLVVIQRVYQFVDHRVSKISRNNRKSELINERLKLGLKMTKGKDRALFAPVLVYRMSRPFLKALIWLALGLLFTPASTVLSSVGYIGSIYYLVKALVVVSPFSFEGDPKTRMEEIQAELDRLEDVDA
ncbi:hypothetical protein [Methylophaga sp. OBS3]|uniref:hypothetical protein n=1 Tax=Methylophaga sp. OBS3 TaxID=2991934 RepID=UPI0022516C5E|nr:hypothetical protein [Methylophaga sp. OBS3]MCX4190850.1 hypothetical protein [Methylophaga sp. OBS3]